MNDDEREKISQLVTEYLEGGPEKITLGELGELLSMPERKITFSYGAVGNWKYKSADVDINSMRIIARLHPDERAREFARRVLEIKGLQLKDGE